MTITDPGAIPDVVPNVTPLAADWGNAIRDRVVNRFATVSARSSAITSPTEGMVCYVTGTDTTYRYTGTRWVSVPGLSKYPEGYFRGYRSGGLNLGTGWVHVQLDAESSDPDSCHTAAGGWVAPKAGIYSVHFGIAAGLNNAAQTFAAMAANLAGSTALIQGSTYVLRGGTALDPMLSAGSGLVELASADVVALHGFNSGGNVIAVSTGPSLTFMHITPVSQW